MTPPGDLADQLLEAHVAHLVNRLRGKAFESLVEEEVDHTLARFGELVLDDVVSRWRVKAVALKYASGFTIPGAIPEVVGEIAERAREHPANEAALGDVVSRKHATAFIRKIAELRAVRERILATIVESPSVQTWLGGYLHSMAAGAVSSNRRMVEKLPGMSSAFSLGDRLAGGVVREADQRSRELADRAAVGILQKWGEGSAAALDDEDLAATMTEIWGELSQRRIRDLLDAIDEDDLIDLIVVGYEFWLEFRTTDYLQSLIDTGVDYFYDTYGQFTLLDLLTEFGLGREDLIEEAMRFAPPVVEALHAAGVLEETVRRQLGGFYDSPEALAILGGASATAGEKAAAKAEKADAKAAKKAEAKSAAAKADATPETKAKPKPKPKPSA